MKRLNEKGNALFLTVLTIVLISVLGISLLNVTANSNKTTVNERYDQAIYYIAEAGLNLEKTKLLSTIKEVNEELKNEINSFQNVADQNLYLSKLDEKFIAKFCSKKPIDGCPGVTSTSPTEFNQFNIQFSKQPTSNTKMKINQNSSNSFAFEFTILSEGYYAETPNQSREVVQTLTFDLNRTLLNPGTPSIPGNNANNPVVTLDQLAIFSKGNITGQGNSTVNGTVGSTNGLVNLGNGDYIVADVEYLEDFDLNTLLPPFPEDKRSSLTKLSSLPQTVSGDIYVDQITIGNGNNSSLTFNIGSNNVTVYVNSLTGGNQSKIIVNGTGTLNLVVMNTFNYEGKLNQNGDIHKLNLYYAGTSNIHLPNNHSQIYGSVYIKDAPAKITGGKIYGNFFYGSSQPLDYSGNGSQNVQYVIAPNAHVNLTGGATINGAVLANSVDATGTTVINYPSNGTFPGQVPSPPGAIPNYDFDDDLIDESPINEK